MLEPQEGRGETSSKMLKNCQIQILMSFKQKKERSEKSKS